jgi:predicted ArsR family transcriptional regulator
MRRHPMATEENQIRKRLKNGTINAKPNKTVVTGMQNELRTQIIVLLNERTASRPEICKELGASFNRVRHEMKVLLNLNPPLIEQVSEKPVRGTVEKFFRATTRARIDQSEWPGVPEAIKGGMRGTLLDMIVDDAVAAVSRDAYDSLENAHMSWTPVILDEEGWEDLTTVLRRTLEEVERIKGDSTERLLAQDAKGTSCTVSILGYPSANEDRKVGPSADVNEDSAPVEQSSLKTETTGKSSTRTAAQKSKRRKSAGR